LEKKKRVSELTKIKEELERSKAEMIYIKQNIESLKILQSVLQQAQGMLREQFTETTNALLADIWQKIYPYRDYTNLKLSIDDAGDYVLQLRRHDGIFLNVEGIASGGERSIACLALRIALSLVLTKNLSWLILDEPTHNLDKRGIQELAKTIRDHLPKIVEQIFVVTHEDELEAAASGSIFKFERNKEGDEPTKVIIEEHI